MLGKLCSGVNHSTIGREFNVNDSTIYIKVSLNRNTHKTRLCIDWLTKMLRPEAHGILTLCISKSRGSEPNNSVFTVTLQNRTTTSNHSQLCIEICSKESMNIHCGLITNYKRVKCTYRRFVKANSCFPMLLVCRQCMGQ